MGAVRQSQRDGEKKKATGYVAEREELKNRDGKQERARWRKGGGDTRGPTGQRGRN